MGNDVITDFNETEGDQLEFVGIQMSDIEKVYEDDDIKYILSDNSQLTLQNPVLKPENNIIIDADTFNYFGQCW